MLGVLKLSKDKNIIIIYVIVGIYDRNYQYFISASNCILDLEKSAMGGRYMKKRIGIGFLVITLLCGMTACGPENGKYKEAKNIIFVFLYLLRATVVDAFSCGFSAIF